jgi:hypothetical protein
MIRPLAAVAVVVLLAVDVDQPDRQRTGRGSPAVDDEQQHDDDERAARATARPATIRFQGRIQDEIEAMFRVSGLQLGNRADREMGGAGSVETDRRHNLVRDHDQRVRRRVRPDHRDDHHAWQQLRRRRDRLVDAADIDTREDQGDRA